MSTERERLLEQQLEVHSIVASGYTVDQRSDRAGRNSTEPQRQE
jgi:hypothetical protein